MKRDIRRQTFSKPGKPNDEEIKRLTGEETNNEPQISQSPEKNIENKNQQTLENTIIGEGELSVETASDKQTETANEEKVNPFLLLRGQSSEIGIEKTGYRLRSEYMDLLKLVKRLKKGYTLEAVLDDALSYYFENTEDGRKAVKQRQMLDSD